jgi:hypothetical protein
MRYIDRAPPQPDQAGLQMIATDLGWAAAATPNEQPITLGEGKR